MAIGALSNFTVPLASDQSATTQGMLMPKLKYRFRVTFENFGVNTNNAVELTKQVQDCARPAVGFANQVIEIYNSKINYAGKPTWEALAVKLRDDVTNNVTKLIGEQNQRQFDFFEQSTAAAAGDYKFTMRIEMLDGSNGSTISSASTNPADNKGVLETWVLYGCYLEKTVWSTLDYKEQGPVVIELTVRFDNAIQTTGGTIGSQTQNQSPRGTNTLGS
jgi:hypothetical protein